MATDGTAQTGLVTTHTDTLTTTTESASVITYKTAPVLLNVRSGPGTGYEVVDQLPAGSHVTIRCQTPGTTVDGYYGTSKIWDNIANGQFISDAYVYTGSDGYVAVRCDL
jgi:uncharacterized protein YraI